MCLEKISTHAPSMICKKWQIASQMKNECGKTPQSTRWTAPLLKEARRMHARLLNHWKMSRPVRPERERKIMLKRDTRGIDYFPMASERHTLRETKQHLAWSQQNCFARSKRSKQKDCESTNLDMALLSRDGSCKNCMPHKAIAWRMAATQNRKTCTMQN